MLVLLMIVGAMALPMTAGFIKSRSQRKLDRRHFAAFVGFTAAIVLLIATLVGMSAALAWFSATHPRHYDPVQQGFVAILGIIGLTSTGVAFFAGFLSDGTRRVTLIMFGPVMVLIYVMGAFTNFGG